jgi:hypothetical protein
MNRLSIISDSAESAGHVSAQLDGIFETYCFDRDGIRYAEPKEYTIVDINLTDKSHLLDIRV